MKCTLNICCFVAVFMVYVAVVVAASLLLIIHFAPRYGSRNVTVYIAICSLIGGFSVLGCKAIGLAVKVRRENK